MVEDDEEHGGGAEEDCETVELVVRDHLERGFPEEQEGLEGV